MLNEPQPPKETRKEGLINAVSFFLSGTAARSSVFVVAMAVLTAIAWGFKQYQDKLKSDGAIVIELKDTDLKPLEFELDGHTKHTAKTNFIRFDKVRPGTHLLTIAHDGKLLSKRIVNLAGGSELRLSEKDFAELNTSQVAVVDPPQKKDAQGVKSSQEPAAEDETQVKVDIVIDPGHGGGDPGAMGSINGVAIKEKDLVLQFSKDLSSKLETLGFSTRLTRYGDYYIPLRERRNLANRRCEKLFVSVHADGFRNPKAKGSAIFFQSEKGETKFLEEHMDKDNKNHKLITALIKDANDRADLIARAMLKRLSKEIDSFDESPRTADFAVLQGGTCPSLLIELGFITNSEDLARVSADPYREVFVDNLANSIYHSLNMFDWNRTTLEKLVATEALKPMLPLTQIEKE